MFKFSSLIKRDSLVKAVRKRLAFFGGACAMGFLFGSVAPKTLNLLTEKEFLSLLNDKSKRYLQ